MLIVIPSNIEFLILCPFSHTFNPPPQHLLKFDFSLNNFIKYYLCLKSIANIFLVYNLNQEEEL
jgi:hypothetical protein